MGDADQGDQEVGQSRDGSTKASSASVEMSAGTVSWSVNRLDAGLAPLRASAANTIDAAV